jgi:hypothetical protein
VLSGEAANINFIVFGLTHPGIEPTIYLTQSEYVNHYTTHAIQNYVFLDAWEMLRQFKLRQFVCYFYFL